MSEHSTPVDELSSLVRAFVRGELNWEQLSSVGVFITFASDGTISVEAPAGRFEIARLADVAAGLLRLSSRFQDLREWASIVLAGVFLSLDEDFSTLADGDAVLNGIWDVAFGDRPSKNSIESAKRIIGLSNAE